MKADLRLPERPNILILYYWTRYPLQITLADHLWCFKRYANARCFYVNLAMRRLPRYLADVQFDLVIFHKLFLDQRWSEIRFEKLCRKIRSLADRSVPKVVMPQDEYIESGRLARFVSEFGITRVISVSPSSEWPKLYPGVDTNRVVFDQALTGYIDEGTRAHIERLSRRAPERSVDIGYRAHAHAWLGRQGQLKSRLGFVFQESRRREGLRFDISVKYGDTFLGDAWYLFLLRCKYTLGVEGGSSVLDLDGSAIRKTENYVAAHPAASFAEVEANCFPGQDGTLNVAVLSPRHLEACITRTCQILVSGKYNGVLEAGRHYIELRPDFSNVDDVLEKIKDDSSRAAIADAAYRDVVASGKYSYRAFVEWLLSTLQPEASRRPAEFLTRLAWFRCEGADRLSWMGVMAMGRLKLGVQRTLFKLFPEKTVLHAWKKFLTRRSARQAG